MSSTPDKSPEGPYTIEWSGENRTARVKGPGFIGPWKKEPTAIHQCADMNAAFAAGQAAQREIEAHPPKSGRGLSEVIEAGKEFIRDACLFKNRCPMSVDSAEFSDAITKFHATLSKGE